MILGMNLPGRAFSSEPHVLSFYLDYIFGLHHYLLFNLFDNLWPPVLLNS